MPAGHKAPLSQRPTAHRALLARSPRTGRALAGGRATPAPLAAEAPPPPANSQAPSRTLLHQLLTAEEQVGDAAADEGVKEERRPAGC